MWGEPTGGVTITITGGTAPYSGGGIGFYLYPYSNHIRTSGALSVGIYSYEFTDAEGCVITGTFTIEDNSDFDVTVTTTPAEVCDSFGSVTFTITGGTAPYYGGVVGTYFYTSPNNVRTLPLGPGTYSYEFTDAEGCVVTGTFIIMGVSNMHATVTTTPSDCNSNGTATIIIAGGTPPYSGPGNQNIPLGIYTITGLSLGDYSYDYCDANGCCINVNFTIEYDEEVEMNCSDFEFTADENSSWPMNPIVSTGYATLTITLNAYTVPDRLVITINGVPFFITAGKCPCGGGGNDKEVVTKTICFKPCDVVIFDMFESVCHDCGSHTEYDLSVTCESGGCGGYVGEGNGLAISDNIDILKHRSHSEMNPERYYEDEKLALYSLESVKVFPNPVTDILNITNFDTRVDYQTARIFDSMGRVILTENISGLHELQIDASIFPNGIYIIEISDSTGHRIMERFIRTE